MDNEGARFARAQFGRADTDSHRKTSGNPKGGTENSHASRVPLEEWERFYEEGVVPPSLLKRKKKFTRTEWDILQRGDGRESHEKSNVIYPHHVGFVPVHFDPADPYWNTPIRQRQIGMAFGDFRKAVDNRDKPWDQMRAKPPELIESLIDIWNYAAGVDCYEFSKNRWGIECADLANPRLSEFMGTGKWNGDFEELRCCLFFEWRRDHFGCASPEYALKALYWTMVARWHIEVESCPEDEFDNGSR